MTEYLVLLKVNPTKIVNAISALRDLPEKPSPGVDLQYVMNVFGTWDVAMWIDFIHKKITQIPGVVDAYTVPTFPNRKPQQGREATPKYETKEEPTGKNETPANE